MINNAIVTVGSEYVYASTLSRSMYINPNTPSAGLVRCNGTMMEAYDGSSWHLLGGDLQISLTQKTLDILKWAESKMSLEQRAVELAKENPSIADALEQVRRAEQELQVLTILSE